MKKSLVIFGLIFLVLGCESQPSEIIEEVYPSDTVIIDNSYPPLDNQKVIEVMEYLQVCSQSDTVQNLPPCSNQFFRIFPIGNAVELENGFLLEMRAGLFGTPVKQLLTIQKTFNKFKIINQYLGFLIEQRTTKSGYNDLLMGYEDPEIGIIAIKHIWIDGKYQPYEVEEINGYFIKPELKDSINHLFIDNFNAGF